MALREIAVRHFLLRVRICAQQVHVVHAHLHRLLIFRLKPGQRRQRRAGHLRVRILRVQIDRRQPLPAIIGGEAHAIIGNGRAPAARAAPTKARAVLLLGAVRVHGDEGAVRAHVAGPQAARDAGEKSALRLCHDHPVVGLGAGIRRVVHLIDRVSAAGLRQHATAEIGRVLRGRGPEARACAVIGGREVILDDRVVRRRRNGRAKETVAREIVVVRAIVEHRERSERGRGSGGGIAIKQCDGESGGQFVLNARGDPHRVCGARDEREIGHAADERRAVRREHGIARARGAAHAGAGGPVLPEVIRARRIDQL